MYTFRPYDPARDFEDACRIWKEVGWMEDGQEEIEKSFLDGSTAWAAEWNGHVESLVTVAPGEMRYLDADLRLAAVTGVVVGRVARKQGLGMRLTAKALAEAAANGAQVGGLSIFDQGFYDKLGFGTGGYEHSFTFDPADLTVPNPSRPPIRLTKDDWERVHAARRKGRRGHGSCILHPAGLTRADMLWEKKAFGLGYTNEDGELTHFLWASPKNVAHGPYTVWWLVYRNGAQLLELFSLLKSWSDQVHTVEIGEPPEIQMQDLLRQPFRARRTRREGKHRLESRAAAYYQWRILDLPACIASMRVSAPLRFALHLHDPIGRYLPENAPWRGLTGEYTLSLGETCTVHPGGETGLPVLEASVGAFTRWWLGVLPASSLALTDDFQAPPALLSALDEALCLPQPHPRWEF